MKVYLVLIFFLTFVALKIILFILSLLILTPNVVGHVDVIAYDDFDQHIGHGMDISHRHLNQHQDDTDEQRKTEHHHHCIDLSVLNVFVVFNQSEDNSSTQISHEKQKISFYKNLYGSNYLDFIFQPPQV